MIVLMLVLLLLLLKNYEMIDISSNSWGLDDDSSKVCVAEGFIEDSYKKGVTEVSNGTFKFYVNARMN